MSERMIIVHPIEAPLFDAMFNHNADISTVMDKRRELFQRHHSGELLNDLVKESKEFAKRLISYCGTNAVRAENDGRR